MYVIRLANKRAITKECRAVFLGRSFHGNWSHSYELFIVRYLSRDFSLSSQVTMWKILKTKNHVRFSQNI